MKMRMKVMRENIVALLWNFKAGNNIDGSFGWA